MVLPFFLDDLYTGNFWKQCRLAISDHILDFQTALHSCVVLFVSPELGVSFNSHMEVTNTYTHD